MKIYLLLYVLSTFLYSQQFNISKGWNLLGATEDFSANDVSFVCVESIFKYEDEQFKSLKISEKNSKSLPVKAGNGLWMYSSSDCIEDTKSTGDTPSIEFVANYKITFNVTWSKDTHPKNFPSGPHFSPLTGAIHNDKVTLWKSGILASPGVKLISETGSSSVFKSEINAIIGAGNAKSIFSLGRINSPSSKDTTFEINTNFPQITAISMIAPSPDWFVGIKNMPLIEDGKWITKKTVDLILYDAGTDSGISFTSPNLATSPVDVIKKLTEPEINFKDGLPYVGQIIIEKIN